MWARMHFSAAHPQDLSLTTVHHNVFDATEYYRLDYRLIGQLKTQPEYRPYKLLRYGPNIIVLNHVIKKLDAAAGCCCFVCSFSEDKVWSFGQ
jgi:hypothetical protein